MSQEGGSLLGQALSWARLASQAGSPEGALPLSEVPFQSHHGVFKQLSHPHPHPHLAQTILKIVEAQFCQPPCQTGGMHCPVPRCHHRDIPSRTTDGGSHQEAQSRDTPLLTRFPPYLLSPEPKGTLGSRLINHRSIL